MKTFQISGNSGIIDRTKATYLTKPRVAGIFRGSLAMLLITSLVMAGCVPPPPTPAPTESPEIVIGILLCISEETPFFISLVEGAEEAAERLDVKLVVQYAHDDVELQCTQIQTLLDEGVSALLVNPVSDAVVPDIEAAAAAVQGTAGTDIPVLFGVDPDPVGHGLVGRAAESNEPVLVPDTSQDPTWLPNSLFPETKSEVAIPISIGNQVLGVLDVQHDVADGLGQEDVDALQAIANQGTVALQNVKQYETGDISISLYD